MLTSCKIRHFKLNLQNIHKSFFYEVRKKEFKIRKKTQSKRVINSSFRASAYSTLRKILIGFILISIANAIFTQLFYTPKVHSLNRKNNELDIKLNLLNSHIEADMRRLGEIKHRDNYVYRPLFGVDSLSIAGIYAPYPDSKYENMESMMHGEPLIGAWKNLDMMAKQLYSNSVSLDELQILAQNKENMTAAIPAIWPIDRTKLRSMGNYGMRFHPIYHQNIFHKGMDLSCDTGTPIYATGDAIVEKSVHGQARKGYGQEILLNHEYNYKTRYAHMSKRYVSRGDTVKRGQLIGEVGSTGGSKGPHLHYEVLYKGNVVNPISYLDREMTNQEYIRLMEGLQQEMCEDVDSLSNEY